jgi:hypothetical protein
MKSKRLLAAVAALCVLAAPAAFAATVVSTAATNGGVAAPASAEPKASEAQARQTAERRARARAAARNVHLATQLARLHGRGLPRTYARRAAVKPLHVLRKSNVRLGRELRALRIERARLRAAFRRVPRSTLDSIAQCESHGNPRAIGGGGRYRGMFQMTFQIWGAVGGKGDPAAASRGEQYYRAALIYTRYGAGQWPVCGR